MKLGSIIARKFRLERVIGRGAMGVVIEATDMTLGRRVAVKLILPHHAADPQLRGRFIREANTMTRLTSEHVARVLEVGELEDGMLFLAMEYLEGQSLEQLIQGGPLPAGDAVDLLLEALDAVTEAHALGLVHRDLKPSNMFLAARNGAPPILKVLDFGIVKDSASTAKLTATGTLPGTPAYMAPEQIALEEHLIDARADIWALGVTLHELLTGALPFSGPMNVMLARIRSEAPPRIRATRPDVAPELEAIALRCLSKHPRDRFANAGELAMALQDLRQRGLVRSERGAERKAAETEISVHRKNARGVRTTAATEADPTGPHRPPPSSGTSRTILLAVGIVALCMVVGFVLAMRRRFTIAVADPPPIATASEAPSASPIPPAAPPPPPSAMDPLPAPAPSRSAARRGARHVRVLSARNTGDAAWRNWVERRRTRIEACAATQACAAHVSLHITKADRKVTVAVQGTATPSDSACVVQPALLACMKELTKDAPPGPDVCTDGPECHADVLLAFD